MSYQIFRLTLTPSASQKVDPISILNFLDTDSFGRPLKPVRNASTNQHNQVEVYKINNIAEDCKPTKTNSYKLVNDRLV